MAELWCYIEAFGVVFGPLLGGIILLAIAAVLSIFIIWKLAYAVTAISDRTPAAVGCWLKRLFGALCIVFAAWFLGYVLYHTKDKICGMTYRNAIHSIWLENK